ncbi:hypothetical protein EVAR_92343_1 [Eumeta japonica]|uniref:Uncharacterized protein n=1 Tax=Eumeta variegata TaxID=151549 RepID=A0A4C1TJS6_EUMVA|nr:hypothetical protein EVAR_92343_1 [Eumeta japonica]
MSCRPRPHRHTGDDGLQQRPLRTRSSVYLCVVCVCLYARTRACVHACVRVRSVLEREEKVFSIVFASAANSWRIERRMRTLQFKYPHRIAACSQPADIVANGSDSKAERRAKHAVARR